MHQWVAVITPARALVHPMPIIVCMKWDAMYPADDLDRVFRGVGRHAPFAGLHTKEIPVAFGLVPR